MPHPPTARTARRAVRLAATAAVAAVMAVSCGAGERAPRDGLEADTARFTYDGRTAEVSLTACGREDDVVVLAGASNGVVLQVEADLGDGGADRTGVTADLGGDAIMGAFGAEMELGPAGEITDVRAEGDRLVVDGVWTSFDGDLRPLTPAQQTAGRLVARCPGTPTS